MVVCPLGISCFCGANLSMFLLLLGKHHLADSHQFSSSTCSRREHLVISWHRFDAGRMSSGLSPNQQYQSTEGGTKHRPQSVAWPHPFFIHHQTPAPCGSRGCKYVGKCLSWLVGWRRGVVASVIRRMNEVSVHWARLVLGWVTVFGWVYHHGV